MELFSLWFVCFLIISLAAYYITGKFASGYQWIVLLVASLVFYGWTGINNLAFIVFTSLTVWGGGVLCDRLSDSFAEKKKSGGLEKSELKALKEQLARRKKWITAAVLIANFGILAFLKAGNQALEAVMKLSGGEFRPLGLVLPLGISFYTFQSAGYLIDVSNSKYRAERSYPRLLLFCSFFPQLIQGPINRFDELSETLYTPRKLNAEHVKRALLLILFGLLKKAAIADLLVDGIGEVFDNVSPGISGSTVIFWILMYSLQQYADFSGGIDMVMGVAQLFGIDMMQNFRQPYFAVSLGDFWRRWHISLGAWMRDYVFYPFALTKPMQGLGKLANKKLGKHFGRTLPAVVANILVFFIVGIWHGTESHFILWGLYNGIIIGLSDLMSPLFEKLGGLLQVNTSSKGFRVFRIIRTFIVVNIGWYFDRIYDLKDCLLCMRRSVTDLRLSELYPTLTGMVYFQESRFLIVILSTVFVFVNSVIRETGRDTYDVLHRRNIVLRWGIYYAMLLLILAAHTFVTISGGFMYANY